MNVKKESFEKDTIAIKQENAFDAPLAESIKKTVDAFENQQTYSFSTAKEKNEPRRLFGKVTLNSIYDVPETQNSEVKACDFFVKLEDLHLIKQEVTKIEYIVPKAELLTDYYDCPTLKSEFLDEPSTSNCSKCLLEQPKYNALKKEINHYKNCLIPQRRLLKIHFWKHWLVCEYCGHFYTDNFEYFTHFFNHTVKMNSRRIMKSKTKKLTSKTNKHRNKSYISNKQIKQLVKKSLIIKHSRTNTDHLTIHTCEKPFKCLICSKQFLKKRYLNLHERIHTSEKLFKCEICFKPFIQKHDLNVHFRIHTGEKPFKCAICFKQFRQKPHLQVHLKIHTREKLFKCLMCSKQFKWESHLNKHLKFHTDEKAFKCEICVKQFTQKRYLNAHLITHTDEKPFKCEICLNQYRSKQRLLEHIKTHTGEKPFKCDVCSKKFKLESYLNEHSRIHIGEKRFKCEICLKQYMWKRDLNQHLRIHTGEKPFKCKICSKQFTRKSSVIRHLKIHTDKKPII